MGEIWSVFCEYFWENWLYYDSTALYLSLHRRVSHHNYPNIKVSILKNYGFLIHYIVINLAIGAMFLKNLSVWNVQWRPFIARFIIANIL